MKRRRGVGSLDTNLVSTCMKGCEAILGVECELACVEDNRVLDFIVVGETVSHLDTPPLPYSDRCYNTVNFL